MLPSGEGYDLQQPETAHMKDGGHVWGSETGGERGEGGGDSGTGGGAQVKEGGREVTRYHQGDVHRLVLEAQR